MAMRIGSARHDEDGNYTGGEAGDQTGSEVSQQAFYVHSKGWDVVRAKKASHAKKLARKMCDACGNSHIGYDQNQRLGIISKGIDTTTDTECDCSSLVRECVIEAMGVDPGNFTTADEVEMLEATGLFKAARSYTASTTLYNGDILVTKTKGHTAIVTSGNPRKASGSSSKPTYEVGETYEVKAGKLNVRTGPRLSAKKKTKSQLTSDARKHANAKGQLLKGTDVTAKKRKTRKNGRIWLKIPSGWVLAWTGSKKNVG